MRWRGSRRTRRGIRAAAVASVVLGAVALPVAASAAPTSRAHAAVGSAVVAADTRGDGTVAGRVLEGAGSAPTATAVVLSGFQGDTEALRRTATTRADGRYAFAGLPTGDGWSFAVAATYKGTVFSTDRFALAAKEKRTADVHVYPSTSSPVGVSLASWTVWLDLTGSTMAVQQDVELSNTGKAAYVGTSKVQGSTPGNKTAPVELPIAKGAGTFAYLGQFEVCCSVTSADMWAHTSPVSPGTSIATMRYEAPFTGTLNFPATLPATSFTLLVPNGTAVSTDGLTRDGTRESKGATYDVYKAAAGIPAGIEMTVVVGPDAQSLSPWWLVAGAVLAVAAAVLIVWMVRRGREQARLRTEAAAEEERAAARAAARAARRRRTSTSASNGSGPAGSAHATVVVDDVDLLADELAMLDVAYESGSLTDEAAYRRVRASLVARMVTAVSAGDPTRS